MSQDKYDSRERSTSKEKGGAYVPDWYPGFPAQVQLLEWNCVEDNVGALRLVTVGALLRRAKAYEVDAEKRTVPIPHYIWARFGGSDAWEKLLDTDILEDFVPHKRPWEDSRGNWHEGRCREFIVSTSWLFQYAMAGLEGLLKGQQVVNIYTGRPVDAPRTRVKDDDKNYLLRPGYLGHDALRMFADKRLNESNLLRCPVDLTALVSLAQECMTAAKSFPEDLRLRTYAIAVSHLLVTMSYQDLRDLTRRANEEQTKTAAALAVREERLNEKLAVLKEKITPYLEMIENQGVGVLPSIEERVSKLEAERRALNVEHAAISHERQALVEKTLRVDVVVEAYRSLRHAIASKDVATLEATLPTVIETVTWTANEKDGGGCYNLSLYENPLELQGLRVPGEPAKEGCSALENQWLPGDDLPRTVRAHRLYGKAKVFVRRERWRVRFVDEPEERRTVQHGSRRRRAWLKNPIIFARQLRAELDAMPNGNQSMLAERHGVTRTRICQYLRLLDLPEEIVEFTGDPQNEDTTANITEAALRELLSLPSAYEQMEAFARMCKEFAESAS